MDNKETSQSRLKVSIIIPLYNKEEYVARCLQSVMKQTYENIECIIVNDASTDNSLQIAQKEIGYYEGIITFHVLQHEKNRGLSAARNTGIKHAQGNYILFLDADDEITPNALYLLVAKANEHHRIDVIQGNIQQIPHSNNYYELKRFNFPEIYTDNESIRMRFFELWKDFPVNACGRLIRTDYIKDNDLFFMDNIIHEDNHWTIKMVRTAQSMSFVYDYVYIRYIVPNSIMTTRTFEKTGHYMGIILSDVVCSIDEKNYLLQFRKFLLSLATWTSRAPRVKTLKTANELFVKESIKHRWYLLAVILTIGRWISSNQKGNKFFLTMVYWWLNRNK